MNSIKALEFCFASCRVGAGTLSFYWTRCQFHIHVIWRKTWLLGVVSSYFVIFFSYNFSWKVILALEYCNLNVLSSKRIISWPKVGRCFMKYVDYKNNIVSFILVILIYVLCSLWMFSQKYYIFALSCWLCFVNMYVTIVFKKKNVCETIL